MVGDIVLAIDGGPAVLADGPPDWPTTDEAIREALFQAAVDGSWGRYHGPHCDRLSSQVASLHGVEHVMLCCSGTVAVELALRGLGISEGDEVLLAGYDFAGNFAAILSVGARPVIVDVGATDWQFELASMKSAVSPATKAMIVSHLHGGMVRMRAIMEEARRLGLQVVEDACQTPGATIDGRTAGCWGDVGVWSFGGSKLLTAGRGGALFTARADVYQRIKIHCERGNHAFPLSEVQALVLCPQMERLAAHNAKRAKAATFFMEAISKIPGLQPLAPASQNADCKSGFYKLGLQYDSAQMNGHSRDAFATAVRAEGVALDAGFRDFTRRGASRCRKVGELNESRRAGQSALVLHHPVLLEDVATLQLVVQAIEKVASAFASSESTASQPGNPATKT